MSDRYIIDLKCVYCKKKNEGVLFNEEWASTFLCEHCGKENHIRHQFKAYKKEDER